MYLGRHYDAPFVSETRIDSVLEGMKDNVESMSFNEFTTKLFNDLGIVKDELAQMALMSYLGVNKIKIDNLGKITLR